MTIRVKDHVLRQFGVASSGTVEDLESKLEALAPGYLDIFHSSASKEELLEIARSDCTDQVEIVVPTYSIRTWSYHSLTKGGAEFARVVHIPANSVELPPTEAEKAIVRAWNLDARVVDAGANETLIGNRIMVLWRAGESEAVREFNRKAIHALLHLGESELELVCDGYWWQRTTLEFSTNCRLLSSDPDNKTTLVLFASAVGQVSVRWRFLSLYRILERGYLSSILTAINRDFMRAPSAAISTAQAGLSNEKSQFLALVDEYNLQPSFVDFQDRVKTLVGAGNRYAAMLNREYGTDDPLKNLSRAPGDEYVKGVVLCYKVRCSIVHSGSHYLVLDEFDDADDALISLAIPLENAVMKYMGVESI